MSDPPDDLDALLSPRDVAPASDRREAVFAQTARVLARVRLVRRTVRGAAVAAVFVAGGLAGWAAKPDRVVVEAVPGPVEVVPVPVVVPVELPTRGLTPPGSPGPEPMTAGAAELLAEQADAPAEAARLYRLAGDKYLDAERDYRNAARCYRLFLARGGDPALSPDPGDTWLLTTLKNAAFKEKFHVAKIHG